MGLYDEHANRYCYDDWEACAENELGLPYFPRGLDPAVRRALIKVYREEQIKQLAELARRHGLHVKS